SMLTPHEPGTRRRRDVPAPAIGLHELALCRVGTIATRLSNATDGCFRRLASRPHPEVFSTIVPREFFYERWQRAAGASPVCRANVPVVYGHGPCRGRRLERHPFECGNG